ncbi:uncharacterized protein [Amphiura filiformis]|uniref:uncharacterized protein n=1 Tax=Amphiura filiformis TaxID=82378 RepID=UPI003B211BA3
MFFESSNYCTNQSVKMMGPRYKQMCFLTAIACIIAFSCKPAEGRLPFPDICPESCTCDIILLQTNCSYANLPILPPLNNNTMVLLFDGNLLNVVESKQFRQLSDLRYLSMAHNQMDEIQEDFFKSQSFLIHLDLSRNKFGEVPIALKHLRILRELLLQGNQIRTLSKEPWNYLTRLTILKLDTNSIPNLPMVMTSNLGKLTNFSIANNEISSIPSGQFANTTNLIHLDLHNNSIFTKTDNDVLDSFAEVSVYLPTAATEEEYRMDDTAEGMVVGSFQGLINLIVLNLAENAITKLENGIFADLSNLEILNLDWNGMKVIEEDVFRIQHKLQILTISNNKLSHLPQRLFEDLRQLRVLKLDSNHISDITPLTNIHMFHLQSLYLNDNSIKTVDSRGFKEYTSIEEIYMMNNKLKHVPEVRGLANLNTLDLSDNNIKLIEPINAFEGTDLQFCY